MAEFLSPGVFIEEVSNAPQQIEAVGTSTMGIVGFTTQGPVDEATLVTSPENYSRKFGTFTNDSLTALAVSAFFSNGGTRTYVIRVVPSDAVAAAGWIYDAITAEAYGTGDGTDPQTIAGTLANLPVVPGSVTVRWTEELTPIVSENPTAVPPEDGTELVFTSIPTAVSPVADDVFTLDWTESIHATGILTFGGNPLNTEIVTIDVKVYTFQTVLTDVDGNVLIGATASDSLDNLIAAITLGAGAGTEYAVSMTVHPTVTAVAGVGDTMDATAKVGGTAGNSIASTTTVTAASWGAGTLLGGTLNDTKTATITGASTVGGTDAANIATATLTRTTGILVITFTGDGPDTDSIRFSYTPVDTTAEFITDNGSGDFTGTIQGTVITGTVDYATGATSVTWTSVGAIPADGNAVTVDYQHCQWDVNALHKGVWGNRLFLQVTGNDNFFTFAPATTAGAGTWSKFDVAVLLQNASTLALEVQETYEEVSFSDTTDLLYFPTLLNESSDFVSIVDNGALDVPAGFKGVARSTVDFGLPLPPDGAITLFTAVSVANVPVVNGSVVITSSFGTATADALGNITGAGLDTAKTNTINYTTGAFTLNFTAGPTGTLTADYISSPVLSTKNFPLASGADGTISTGFNRSVISAPALQATKRGMFALDRIDENMQLVIPDFMGDTTIMGDMLDYVDLRKDIFALLATPQGMEAQEAKDFKLITFGRTSKFAAMYWPWIKVADPLGGPSVITMPPVAHVAGVIARTDNTRNVGKAPGGTVDGALKFLVGLEKKPDKGERETVGPARINSLIDTPQTGKAVWGVRTMAPTNDIFRYINAVRLFQFVEKSTFNSTQFAVFENINTGLFNQIKTTMDSFLGGLFNSGHFAGDNPSQSFFVVVDGTNNTPTTINDGKVIIDVGIAPNRPAEFVIFRFAQKTL